MSLRNPIRAEDFDELLCWLDPERDRAGERYEHIRHTLIKIFVLRHCEDAEALADTTIDRVLKKIPTLRKTYVGDPALYFYGVAKNIVRENARQSERKIDIDHLSLLNRGIFEDDRTEVLITLLEEWLATLTDRERNLLLNYYAHDGIARIRKRQKLGKEWNLSSAALRQRVHRLKADFLKWMME